MRRSRRTRSRRSARLAPSASSSPARPRRSRRRNDAEVTAMRKLLLALLGVGLVSLVLLPRPAGAWMHAGRWGTASGGGGSWDAEGWHGGSASGGDGSWHARGAWGDSASGGDGSWSGHGADGGHASGGEGSWSATTPYGNEAYHNGYGTTYDVSHPTDYYGAYHPPVVVNEYP